VVILVTFSGNTLQWPIFFLDEFQFVFGEGGDTFTFVRGACPF
jgi:hypothetical protein